MIHKRDRMALRADKWWRSVWLQQMLMWPRGWKPLTVKDSPARVKAQSKPRSEK